MGLQFIIAATVLFIIALTIIALRIRLTLNSRIAARLTAFGVIAGLSSLCAIGVGFLDHYYGERVQAIQTARINTAADYANQLMNDAFTDNMNAFASNIASLSTVARRLEKKMAVAANASMQKPVTINQTKYTTSTAAVNATLLSETKRVNRLVQIDANLRDTFANLTENRTDDSQSQFRQLHLRLTNAQNFVHLMTHYHGNWQEHERLYEQYAAAIFY